MFRFALLMLAAGLSAADSRAEDPARPEPAPRLRVQQVGGLIWIRSSLSATTDLVALIGKGENGQVNFNKVFAAAAGRDVADLTGGLLVNQNEDDTTPWFLNGTYIGANHGCSDARVITCPRHGLTKADLGSEWGRDQVAQAARRKRSLRGFSC